MMKTQEVPKTDSVNETLSQTQEVPKTDSVNETLSQTQEVPKTDSVNETLSQIKELLENKETSSADNLPTQEVPLISEEEFIKFNNNFCLGISSVVLVCGIICGVVVALFFKGMFKDN